jgi:hypothetical protein
VKRRGNFKRSYEHPCRVYVLAALAGGRALVLNQICDALAAEGIVYTEAAVRQELEELRRDGAVERVAAPAYFAAKFAYRKVSTYVERSEE